MKEQQLAKIEEQFLGIHSFDGVMFTLDTEPVCKFCPDPRRNIRPRLLCDLCIAARNYRDACR